MNVDPDGNCGYHVFIKACNYSKNKVDFPVMDLSCESILDMKKDLRKWCNENYHLFVYGDGIEDQLMIGCKENVSTMYKIFISILKREFKNIQMMLLSSQIQCCCRTWNWYSRKKSPGIILPTKSTTYMHHSTSHFLPTYIRHKSFAMKFLGGLNNHVPLPIHDIT